MSDILDRLRDRIHDSPMPAEHLMDEAAAEIELLRAILAGIKRAGKAYGKFGNRPGYPGKRKE